MFLVDTNIFLEVILRQNRKEDCKRFLGDNKGKLNITDFSLHSIGVILFKHGKENVFLKFIKDIVPNVKIVSLPSENYGQTVKTGRNFNLDFDDAYQYSVADYFGFKMVTMDRDFHKIKNAKILFL